MRTFCQFISEERESHIGWLSHDDEPLTADAEHSHEGLSSAAWALTDTEAIKAGHVRFYHHHEPNKATGKMTHHAGYELRDHPQTRKLAADHLAKSGGFHRIDIDIHHKNSLGSHSFRSRDDAVAHLRGNMNESLLFEHDGNQETGGESSPAQTDRS